MSVKKILGEFCPPPPPIHTLTPGNGSPPLFFEKDQKFKKAAFREVKVFHIYEKSPWSLGLMLSTVVEFAPP